MSARSGTTLAALGTTAVLLGASAWVTAAPPPARAVSQDGGSGASELHAAGRWLVDDAGRVVVLHGVNQVRKLDPYLPSAVGFGADDAAYLASQGFNTVRTGVHHKGLAPAPGEYDRDYLADFVDTVQVLQDAGLYVLVDFHHDMYNERYQGNGFADWATVDSSPTVPAETIPQCMAGFPGNYFTCQFLWEANDRFYGISGREPEVGPRGLTLQEEFADAWVPVAEALRGRPLVFGYNILNEPTPGSQVLACLEPLGCPPATDEALRDFNNLAALVIRDVDPSTMVWYEPWATNFNAGFPTHHGDLDIDDVGLSFHVYACPFAIPGVPVPDPGLADECDTIREQAVFDNAEGQARAYGHPGLVTEFGATDDLATIDRVADLADLNMVGWQYWAWWNEDPCCERPSEGIIDHPSNPPTDEHLKQDKLDVLVRPFPRAVAGTPTSWSWDEEARRFDLRFDVAAAGPALTSDVTEVWVPRRHFPTGYDVVDLAGAYVVSDVDAEALHLRTVPGATEVRVAIAPATSPRTPDTPEPEPEPEPDDGAPLPVTGGGAALVGLLLVVVAARGRRHPA